MDPTTSEELAERAFIEGDFRGLSKSNVYALAKEQKDKWPTDSLALNSHTNKSDMVSNLLNKSYGFTTKNPLPTVSSTTGKKRKSHHGNQPSTSSKKGPNVLSSKTPKDIQPVSGTGLVQPLAVPTPRAHTILVPIVPRRQSSHPDSDSSNSSTPMNFESLPSPSKMLHVMICDKRSMDQEGGVAVAFALNVVREDLKAGTWPVSAQELLRKIQASPAAIDESDGPLSILYSYPLDPNFRMHIVHQCCDIVGQCPPSQVLVGPDNKLYISIIGAGPREPSQILHPKKRLKTDDIDIQNHPAYPAKRLRPQTDDEDKKIVEKLKEELSMTVGYAEFIKNHGKSLQNPDIVVQWQFISKFVDTMRSKVIDRQVVRKYHIYTAFGLSETTVNQAVKAVQFIDKYGMEGNSFSQKVQNQLNLVVVKPERPSGSVKLYRFLEKYNDSQNE